MMLFASTDKLQLVTSAAASIDVIVSWVDLLTNGSGTPALGRTLTAITTATTTDIMVAPAASTHRNVKEMTIKNKHATLACDVTPLFNLSATQYEAFPKWTLLPGELMEYIEGVGFFKIATPILPLIGRALAADNAGGQNVATAQPWFPTNGALTVPSATAFWMWGRLNITSGATTHTTGLNFTGTATLTAIDYYAQIHRSAADTIISVFSGINAIVATNVVLDVTGTQVGHYIAIEGILRINVGGTFIPNFQFSANPTGTITIKRGSHFWLQQLGDNAMDKIGTWT